MRDSDRLASALAGALRQLTERVTALCVSLASSRTAFAGASARALAKANEEQQALAEQVHAGEGEVASLRTQLCASLNESPAVRMRTLLARLAPAPAHALAEAAAALRQALQALRVESVVGQRLLDVTRRAQEGLHRALVSDRLGQRYDRHARSVQHGRSGGIVQGTI